MNATEQAGRAFCDVVVCAIHDKVRARGGGNIPADIAMTASQICASVGITDSHARKVFAAAILAERQRCADVAEGFRQAHDTGSGFDSQPARQTAAAIRDAILA